MSQGDQSERTPFGRHVGDAGAFLETLPEIGLMITDPPWKLSSGGRFSACASYATMSPKVVAEKLDPGRRRMVKGGHAYVFAPASELLPGILDAFLGRGWRFLRLLAWDKGVAKGLGAFRNGFEPVLVFSNGPTRGFLGPPQKYSSLFKSEGVPLRTSKPWTAYRVFMEMSSHPGELVVDPFCGTNPLKRAAGSVRPARRWAASDLLTEAEISADLKNRTWDAAPRPSTESKIEVFA